MKNLFSTLLGGALVLVAFEGGAWKDVMKNLKKSLNKGSFLLRDISISFNGK